NRSNDPFDGPNIILISIDALRADHLSCYGYHRNTSPNIDQLAREGVLFKNGFSQACSTMASHSSIFLSQYPWTHEVVGSKKKIAKSSLTLAEILKNRNYITAGFVGGGYVSSKYGFGQGFDFFFDKPRTWHTLKSHKDNLFRWLEKVRDKKFFLFIHTYDVHSPYNPPIPYRALYIGDYSDQRCLNELVDYELTALNLSPEEIDYVIALYDAGINYVDNEIGELVKKLRKLNIFDNSFIIITADHGERLGEEGRVGHGREASRIVTHVPLIMRVPEIGQGKIIEEIVESIDITPTILDILDISLPEGMQGKSILPLIKGSGSGGNLVAYTSEGEEKANLSRAIRTKEWTYIMNQNGLDELYNRIDDPKEQKNLIKERPRLAQRLKEELEDFIALTSEGKPQVAEKVDIDEELKKRLKSLGYLH
ncbi:MAG: sulfatase, partial [bacterium]